MEVREFRNTVEDFGVFRNIVENWSTCLAVENFELLWEDSRRRMQADGPIKELDGCKRMNMLICQCAFV